MSIYPFLVYTGITAKAFGIAVRPAICQRMLAIIQNAFIAASQPFIFKRAVIFHVPVQRPACFRAVSVTKRKLDPLLVNFTGRNNKVLFQVGIPVKVQRIDNPQDDFRANTAAAVLNVPLQPSRYI
jgi:hypothetical protein